MSVACGRIHQGHERFSDDPQERFHGDHFVFSVHSAAFVFRQKCFHSE